MLGSATPPVSIGGKPRNDEVDVFGESHRGLVRPDNQDHFVVCSLQKAARVHATNIPLELFDTSSEWMAFIGMVADGVGGHVGGEQASRAAIEAVVSYLSAAVGWYHISHPGDEAGSLDALADAARRSHEAVLERAQEHPELTGMATTLTLAVVVWPKLYLVQVGDRLRPGRLEQLSRDQTVAQELIDKEGLPADQVLHGRWAHVLTSAIGSTTLPVVTSMDVVRDDVWLLCTDGLTKHVPDARIEQQLRDMTSAAQVCRALVQDALDGGGTDNVTVVVGRSARGPGSMRGTVGPS